VSTPNNSRLAGLPNKQSAAIGTETRQNFDGFIKLRLGHASFGSALLPELLFLQFGADWKFYQPSFFGPPILGFNVEPSLHRAHFSVDVGGPRASNLCRLVIEIKSDRWVRRYADGAQLYRCVVEGPKGLSRCASGKCWRRKDGDFNILLFHITDRRAFSSIVSSRELRSSKWNLQGTRRLKNVSYVYLTSLPSIETEEDLRRIAMSSDGTIQFQTTSGRGREETLELEVYRESTTHRTTRLRVVVESDVLTPPHLLIHRPIDEQTYYEVVAPEIYRVGLQPEHALEFERGRAIVEERKLKTFDYIVVGDTSIVDGLAAPYDEEESKQIMHVEKFDSELDLFGFWLEHQNSDQVSARHTEPRILSS
jgi:hypothetical protein